MYDYTIECRIFNVEEKLKGLINVHFDLISSPSGWSILIFYIHCIMVLLLHATFVQAF